MGPVFPPMTPKCVLWALLSLLLREFNGMYARENDIRENLNLLFILNMLFLVTNYCQYCTYLLKFTEEQLTSSWEGPILFLTAFFNWYLGSWSWFLSWFWSQNRAGWEPIKFSDGVVQCWPQGEIWFNFCPIWSVTRIMERNEFVNWDTTNTYLGT